MEAFQRRTYAGFGEFWEDVQYLLSRRSKIKRAMDGELISEAFRERLMNVVTEVNDCRYCRSFHLSQASRAGVSKEELVKLTSGLVSKDTPEDEIPGLLYAQHWAEQNARPEEDRVQELKEHYPAPVVEAIHIILRMIRSGNLMGNSFDYLLYKLSFGRWGQSSMKKPEL
ncbi:MAG: carboxymuconolactone decarboxylase family protein [Anaerolineales bacterium]